VTESILVKVTGASGVVAATTSRGNDLGPSPIILTAEI